jgi:hypothetical protein
VPLWPGAKWTVREPADRIPHYLIPRSFLAGDRSPLTEVAMPEKKNPGLKGYSGKKKSELISALRNS